MNPASGSKVVLGQTLTINFVSAGILQSSCIVSNGNSWLAYPDGTTVSQIMNTFQLPAPNTEIDCTGPVGGGGGSCLAYTTTYVVNAADIGKTLQLGSPTVIPRKYAQNGNNPSTYPGLTDQIHFFSAAEGDGYNGPFNSGNFGSSSGLAYGEGQVFFIVVHPGLTVTKVCDTNCFAYGAPISYHGSICNTGNVTLANITITDTPGSPVSSQSPITFAATTSSGRAFNPATGLTNGECVTYSGSYQPDTSFSLCGPFNDTIVVSGTANTVFQSPTYYATNTASCPICTTPAISVTKNCPPTPAVPGGLLTFSGQVCNTGNVPLTNVTIFNDRVLSTGTNLVASYPLLTNGECRSFIGSELVPTNVCSIIDTLTARGTNICNLVGVVATATTNCPVLTTPHLVMTKECPRNPTAPGQLLVFTGTITNTGDVAVTNIVIVNNEPTNNTPVLTIQRLEPGQGTSFTGSYLVPTDVCALPDTLAATGTTVCGVLVSASASRTCPVLNTPRLVVTKVCPPSPVPPGGIAVFSGTVSNAGNITLTNVIVVNDRPTNNTPIIGPLTLAPGQSTNFMGSETVPLNCCAYYDTLTGTATSVCGTNVLTTTAAVCPTLTIPALSVTKSCPPYVVPLGQPLVYSGVVSNAGNVTLTNVTVVDNQPTNNTPVLGPISLAPGETVFYIGSYVVPINICSPSMDDTVTASGFNVCSGTNVTATKHTGCAIIASPRITITKHCPPNPVAPGQLLVYSGSVSNAGDTTLTNVTVVNDRPVSNTLVLGPITLTPGQSTNFTGSYIAPYDCCGPCVDTLTARSQEICAGGAVDATASDACPRITTPSIAVTRDCPPDPVNLGDLVFFTGTVSNTGDATLINVLVVDDQAGVLMQNEALSPSESIWFWGMYFPQNCGASVASGITATANDICTETVVSNRFVTACAVVCPPNHPVTLFGPMMNGTNFQFSFNSELNSNYKVQCTDSLQPVNWQDVTNYPGSGGVITVPLSTTNTQRFYRVVTQ